MKDFDYDYKNYDKITIFVQKDKEEEIIHYYSILKWELKNNVICKNSTGLVELTFIRPHKIPNKDKLQLYQVQMEECLNNIGKLENFKDSKTTTFGLVFGLLGLTTIIFAILMFCNIIYSPLYLKIILSITGSILSICNFIFIKKVNNKEKENFKNKFDEQNNILNEICTKIMKFTEDKNE